MSVLARVDLQGFQGWMMNSNEEYHAGAGISSTPAKAAADTAAHYKAYLEQEREPSPAMLSGTRIHAATLEPVNFERDYVTVGNCTAVKKSGDPCTNAGVMLSQGHALCGVHAKGRAADRGEVISQDDYDRCIGCRDAIMAHPEAKALLTGGVSEASGYLWHNDTLLKVRPDYRIKGEVITDIKSAESAKPNDFVRQIVNFKYHLSAEFYRMCCSILDGCKYEFRWIVVEKTPPYGVMVYAPSPDMMDQGNELVALALRTIRKVESTGEYPCYPQSIQTIDLPRWAKEKR